RQRRDGRAMRGEVGCRVYLSDEAASLKRLGSLLGMFPPRFVAVARPPEMALNDVTAILYLPHNDRDPVPPNDFAGHKVYDPATGKYLPLPPELGGGIVIYDSKTGFALPMPEEGAAGRN